MISTFVNLKYPGFLTPMIYWPFIESSLGIVGACLPLYRPLADTYFIKSVLRRMKSTFSQRDFEPVSQDSQHSSLPGSDTEGAAHKKSGSGGDAWLRAYGHS